MLGDKRFLRTIQLRNILSFGPDTPELELKPLNVLIGPNGSGKSNLIEAISLLQAAPTNLLAPIRSGGGIVEWLWKGVAASPVAEIETNVDYPDGKSPLHHRLAFTMQGQQAEIVDEAIDCERKKSVGGLANRVFFYRRSNGRPVLNVKVRANLRICRTLKREDLIADQSVLSQRVDPDQYPEVT